MKGKELRRTLEKTATNLAETAQRVGGTYLEAGRQKVEDTVSDAKETLRKHKETPEIIERAKRRLYEAIARYEAEREAGQETAARLQSLEQALIEDEFARFGRLYESAVNRTLVLCREDQAQDMTMEVPTPDQTESVSAELRGMAAGGLTAASAVALTALFGTTAAGTAISGLSGSAFIGATLASLGGGSLAAGGLGIAGGLAVLGGAFALPAVAIGVHFWSKDVERNYEFALRYEEKVDVAVAELDMRRKGVREASRFAQSLFHDLLRQQTVLDSMLDIFEQSLSFGRTKEAFSLCGHAIALMGKNMTIDYRMEKMPSDEAAWSDLRLHALAFSRTEQRFGAYVASLEAACREEAERVFAAQEERMERDDKRPKRSPLKNEEIRKLLEDTFLSFAKQEICLIAPWVTNRASFDLMEAALKRGVTVKVLYGIQDGKGGSASSESEKRMAWTRENIEALRTRFSSYGTLFRAKEGNTHAKLLIADDSYYYIGSYNLLSFRGEYEQKASLRDEIGDYSEDAEMIRFYKRTYFDF